LAARIIGAFDADLSLKLATFAQDLQDQVAEKNLKLKAQL